MRLRTKVALATVSVSLISSFAVGLSVLGVIYNNGIRQIQEDLTQIVQIVESSFDDPVSTALLAVSEQEISLGFVESDGTITPLQESAGPLDDTGLEKKEMRLSDDEKLIFAKSTKSVISSTLNSLIITLALASLVSALGIFLSWIVTRSDLKNLKSLTGDAQEIAGGNMSRLRKVSGSEELVILSNSLSQLIDKLQASKKHMEEFLGDASHELRTPLTVIRGYLDMLKNNDDLSSAQSEKAIKRAYKEALRMQTLVSDILLLTELGEERQPEFSQLYFEEIFSDLIEDLRIQNPERTVTMTSNQQAPFIGSSELLQRLMQNALSNIMRYTPNNAEVMVQISEMPTGFEINIDDAGPGIATLVAEKEITAFTRFDKSRSRDIGGSGLGLSIMAKIIQTHRGEMRLLRSNLGGLRVSIFLPSKKS